MNCACGGVYWNSKCIHIYSCEQTPKCPHCHCRQDMFPWEPRHNETCKILQHPNPLEISLALSRLPKQIYDIIYNFLPYTYNYETIPRNSRYLPYCIGSSDLKLYYIRESLYPIESKGYTIEYPDHTISTRYCAIKDALHESESIHTLPTTIPNESIKQIKHPEHTISTRYCAIKDALHESESIHTLPTTIPNESIKQIKLRQKKSVPKLSRLERKPLLPKMRFYK